MVGSVVQNDLFTILYRFRFQVITLSADIAKMYRQVELDKHDQDFHRLLWRNTKEKVIQHLRMKRVTYGIASSAFHSTRCLKDIAIRTELPAVADDLNQCFYVDFLGGAKSIAETRQIVKDLCQQLSDYGPELRKWTSSHPELTTELPLELRGTSLSKEFEIKALGICWKANADSFVFSIELTDIEQQTKRALLSDSSKVFDPMGWIGPIIIVFNCLIQQTWD